MKETDGKKSDQRQNYKFKQFQEIRENETGGSKERQRGKAGCY